MREPIKIKADTAEKRTRMQGGHIYTRTIVRIQRGCVCKPKTGDIIEFTCGPDAGEQYRIQGRDGQRSVVVSRSGVLYECEVIQDRDPV